MALALRRARLPTSSIGSTRRSSKLKARLADLGGTPLAGPPGDFGKLIADETANSSGPSTSRRSETDPMSIFHEAR
jgi:hypothetical protein